MAILSEESIAFFNEFYGNQMPEKPMAQTVVEWLDNELWKLRLKLRGGEISVGLYCEQEVKLIAQAKQMEREQKENALKIIEAQNQYIEVLRKEIDSAVSIAHIHGWRSNLVEEGENLRNEIALLNKSFNNFI